MIAAVILASGYSQRMGRSKLTLALGGATFLQRAMRAAGGATRIGRLLVVLRPEDASVIEGSRVPSPESRVPTPGSGAPAQGSFASAGTRDPRLLVDVLLNNRASEGQSASIRLATERLAADPRCEAIIFSVVDQPFLDSCVFDALAQAWESGRGEILVATYDGKRGSPVLFARRFFGDLAQLAGDVGGREVIRRYPEAVAEVAMPDPAAGQDVDTWEDYLRAQESLSAQDPASGYTSSSSEPTAPRDATEQG